MSLWELRHSIEQSITVYELLAMVFSVVLVCLIVFLTDKGRR